MTSNRLFKYNAAFDSLEMKFYNINRQEINKASDELCTLRTQLRRARFRSRVIGSHICSHPVTSMSPDTKC